MSPQRVTSPRCMAISTSWRMLRPVSSEPGEPRICAHVLAAVDGQVPTRIGGHGEVLQRSRGGPAEDIAVRVVPAPMAVALKPLRRDRPLRADVATHMGARQRHGVDTLAVSPDANR